MLSPSTNAPAFAKRKEAFSIKAKEAQVAIEVEAKALSLSFEAKEAQVAVQVEAKALSVQAKALSIKEVAAKAPIEIAAVHAQSV